MTVVTTLKGPFMPTESTDAVVVLQDEHKAVDAVIA